jgi:hypothetical protein
MVPKMVPCMVHVYYTTEDRIARPEEDLSSFCPALARPPPCSQSLLACPPCGLLPGLLLLACFPACCLPATACLSPTMKIFLAAAMLGGAAALDNPCLGVPGPPTLTAEKCNASDPYQHWSFVNGTIVRMANSSECVSVENYRTDSGAPFVVSPCHPGDTTKGHLNQAFTYVTIGSWLVVAPPLCPPPLLCNRCLCVHAQGRALRAPRVLLGDGQWWRRCCGVPRRRMVV